MLRDSRGRSGETLRLVPPGPASPRRTPLGNGWRHDFDIVLTVDGPDLVVYDGTQARRVFEPVPTASEGAAERFVGRERTDGEILVTDTGHVWRHAGDGTTVTFAGSRPVRTRAADGRVATWRYDGARLLAVIVGADGDDDRAIRFGYDGSRLSTVTFSDGTRHVVDLRANDAPTYRGRAAAGECRADDEGASGPTADEDDDRGPPDHDGSADGPIGEESEPARCDVESTPPDPSFATIGIPGATRVDARPASCTSYFVEHHGTERGTAIENGLSGLPHYVGYAATVRSFPVADFVGAELRVVRSRDLSLPSYDVVPDGLFERLLRDGDEIARDLLESLAREGSVSVTESGRTTTLVHRPNRPTVLELVVRHGIASVDQRLQIRRAATELAARHGIHLRVVEIP